MNNITLKNKNEDPYGPLEPFIPEDPGCTPPDKPGKTKPDPIIEPIEPDPDPFIPDIGPDEIIPDEDTIKLKHYKINLNLQLKVYKIFVKNDLVNFDGDDKKWIKKY